MQTKERVSIQIVEEPKVLLRKRRNKSILGIFVSMEKCLDLALRKGKAGGEPKPTENKYFCKAVGRHYRVPDEG